MRNKRPSGRRKKRLLKRLLLLLVIAAIFAGAWAYLKPLLTESSVNTYASYTVGRGDIATSKSFSATLSVGDSETLYNDSGAESIRQLYVTGGQEVKEGDKLMELSDGTVLKAGIDGVVNEIRYAAGDWLRPNAQLVQVCDLTNLQVSLSVDEYDVEKVAAGQPCTITIVPLGLDFETELTHVSRLSSATGRVAYYTATAELAVPENVLPGMTASVTIPADSVTDALVLDMAAIAFDEDGDPYVLRRNGSDYEQVAIETGLSDGMQVEILSGLSEGEEVWAVSGTENVQAEFSLTEVYKRIFGETVVINPESGTGGGRNRGGFDMSQFAEGMTLPEGVEFPTGGTFPFGGNQSDEAEPDSTETADPQEAAEETASPEATASPEGRTRPEGMDFPTGERPSRPGGTESTGEGFGLQRTERQRPDGQQETTEDTTQQGSDGQ